MRENLINTYFLDEIKAFWNEINKRPTTTANEQPEELNFKC